LRDDMPAERLHLVEGAYITPGTIGHGGDPRPDFLIDYRVNS